MINLKHNIGSRSTFRYPFPSSISINIGRMQKLVEKHWMLNRTAVNPDTDKLVNYIKKQLGAHVLEAKSGEECLTWHVPKRWWVRKGQLRGKDGTIIADFKRNPL